MIKPQRGSILIPPDRRPWPHELHVAEILANAGHDVEFLPENIIKSADIMLDGIGYEIKSPLTSKTNTLEHTLKRALRQSPNIIIDSSRTRLHNDRIRSFLLNKAHQHKQIKRLLLITKERKIIDIKALT